MQLPHRASYRYHPHYCEENIWHLCQRPEFADSQVLVVAANGAFFPILCQREAVAPHVPLLWDYHVILLWRASDHQSYILDFDTTLPFCTPVAQYFQQAFLDEYRLKPAFVPWFRVMLAPAYVVSLQSDRRHMKTATGWLSPPPAWPPLSTTTSNLHKFTDMTDREYGQILSASELLHYAL
jgi:hypothetical protein